MTNEQLLQKNLNLSQELTLKNRSYYNDFSTYIRKHTFFSKDESIEPLLFEILQDLLQAQNDGLSAEEYFGSNPQQTADELIRNMKPKSKEVFWKKAVVPMLGVVHVPLLVILIEPSEYLGLLHLVIVLGISILLGLGMFLTFILGKRYKQKRKNSVITAVFAGVVFALVVLGAGFVIAFSPDFYLPFPSWLRLVAITGIMGWSVILVLLKDKKERLIHVPILVLSLLLGFQGMATHTFFKEQLGADFLGMDLRFYLNQASIVIFAILFFFVIFAYTKKMKRSD